MGVVVRQSIKASIVTYIGAGIGFLNIILVTPYCLPPEIVGLSRAFIEFAGLLVLIAQMGINSGIIKFHPEFEGRYNNLVFLAYIIPLAGFTILAVLFFFSKSVFIDYFASNSPLFNEYLNYTIPLALILLLTGITETFSYNMRRIVVPNLIKNVVLKIANIATILLFYFKVLDVKQFIISIIAIYGIALLLNVFYFKRLYHGGVKPDFSSLDRPLLKRFLKYISFVFVMGIGSSFATKIDVFMISSSLDLAKTGIYTIAFYILSAIEIPSRSLLMISNPLVSEYIHKGNHRELSMLYKKSSLVILIVGGILFLFVWVNIDNIFKIMPNGDIYKEGKYVILFLGLSKLLDTATGINGSILGTSKFYPYMAIFFAYLTVATVWLNYIFIPIYGITGAAFATLLSMGSFNLFMTFFLKFKMKMFPFDLNALKVLALLALLFLANELAPDFSNPYLDGVLKTFALFLVLTPCIYYMKISDEINSIIRNVLKFKFSNIIR